MRIRIDYKASVERDLQKLDKQAANRILTKIERTLRAEGHRAEALTGEFTGLFRLRVGDHRVIYIQTDAGYLVLRIGHRGDVYRRGKPATP